MISEQIANIILGVCLFTIFVSIFYFNYVKSVEAEIVTTQINILVDSFTSDLKLFNVKLPINTIQPPDMTAEDLAVQTSNAALISKATQVVSIFSICCILISLGLWWLYEFDLKSILISNAILIIFVGFTEYYYITYISKSFQSLDPSMVKLNIIKNIQNF